jgi:hypothetical protein
MRCDKPLPTAPDPTPPRRSRRDTKAILSRSRVHPAKMHATRMKMPSEPLLFGCRAGETDDGLRPFSSRRSVARPPRTRRERTPLHALPPQVSLRDQPPTPRRPPLVKGHEGDHEPIRVQGGCSERKLGSEPLSCGSRAGFATTGSSPFSSSGSPWKPSPTEPERLGASSRAFVSEVEGLLKAERSFPGHVEGSSYPFRRSLSRCPFAFSLSMNRSARRPARRIYPAASALC